jgi:hypothetical protein
MKNCSDEQLARAFLLGALRDGLLSEAAAGLAVTSFQHKGEPCWQLPPNVLRFVPRQPRRQSAKGTKVELCSIYM